jgi:glycosyltransferase involved in cell wall biosynthesis
LANVLYISRTGLLDALGQSQVLQYLVGLSHSHAITLITFEKQANLDDDVRLAEISQRCREAKIDWQWRTFHDSAGFLGTLFDLVVGSLLALRLARQNGVGIVHCRSYVAGILGLLVKRRLGCKFVFDMRGFWPDERVDGGIWKLSSMQYRIFKWFERRLFLAADHVVSLTRAGAREFEKFDYLQGRAPPFSVIPTCTNLDLFRPMRMESASPEFTLGYVGSVGSWYMFDWVANAVRILFELEPNSRFFVVNKGGHDIVRQALVKAKVDLNRVELKAVAYERVGEEIARMDAGLFFIKPVWSKLASCPTRMGEFLGCGKPLLANAKVGDVEEDLRATRTGVTVSLPCDDDALRAAIIALLELRRDAATSGRCREAAERLFSLSHGIASYNAVYSSLTNRSHA